MFERTKVKICHLLLKKGQYLLASVLPLGDNNFSCSAMLSVDNGVLTESLDQVMQTHKEIREYILARAATFLKTREIDTKHFIEEITK